MLYRQLVLAFALISFFPSKAVANPASYGMQMCSMMRAGTSQRRAWNYIIEQHTMRTGGQIGGFGIAAGIIAGQQLRGMRNDVFAVAKANCPDAFGIANDAQPSTLTPEASNKNSSSYCTWNPWKEECKNGSLQKSQSTNACNQALQKYECKYQKYLDANSHMKDWVKANPEMARKEALRLKAVDAEEIGYERNEKHPSSAADRPKSAAQRAAKTLSPSSSNTDCLKAADYKGCMEYHNRN